MILQFMMGNLKADLVVVAWVGSTFVKDANAQGAAYNRSRGQCLGATMGWTRPEPVSVSSDSVRPLPAMRASGNRCARQRLAGISVKFEAAMSQPGIPRSEIQ